MSNLTSNTDVVFLTLECLLKHRIMHVAQSQRTSQSRQGTLDPDKFCKRLQRIRAWPFNGLEHKIYQITIDLNPYQQEAVREYNVFHAERDELVPARHLCMVRQGSKLTFSFESQLATNGKILVARS